MKITIEGTPGEGKTTCKLLIMQALRKRGFVVEFAPTTRTDAESLLVSRQCRPLTLEEETDLEHDLAQYEVCNDTD